MSDAVPLGFPYPPEDYLREIGRIVVASNRLDSLVLHTLIIAIAGGFSEDGRALAVAAPMGFQARVHALEALLRLIDDDIATVYRKQIRHTLEEAQGKHNSAVHQEWVIDDGSVKRISVQAKGSLKISLDLIDIQDVRATSRFIDDTHSMLFSLITMPLVAKLNP